MSCKTERGGVAVHMHLAVLPGENKSKTLQSFLSDDEAEGGLQQNPKLQETEKLKMQWW